MIKYKKKEVVIVWRKWKSIIISLFFAIVISALLKRLNLVNLEFFLKLEKNNDQYWNIINFSSIISGFMFTALGIILSTADGKVMKYLASTNIVDRMYINIVFGIWGGIFSIILSLFMIISTNEIFNFLVKIIPYVLLISIIFTLQCFVKSTKDVWYIIKQTRKSAINEKMSLERRQAVYEDVKKVASD